MNKKGIGAEVDWIIAIGIFLIAFGAILVLFKPGIRPVFESDTLLDIVQQGVENQLTWNITKQPFFTEPVSYEYKTSSGGIKKTNTNAIKYGAVFEMVGTCKYNPATKKIESCQKDFPVIKNNFPWTANPSVSSEKLNNLESNMLFFYEGYSDVSSEIIPNSQSDPADLPVGSTCTDAKQCVTNYCTAISPKTCALAPAGTICISDTQCESQDCVVTTGTTGTCAAGTATVGGEITADSSVGDGLDALDMYQGRDSKDSQERKLKFRLGVTATPPKLPTLHDKNPILKLQTCFKSPDPIRRKYLMVFGTNPLVKVRDSNDELTAQVTAKPSGYPYKLRACELPDYSCPPSSSSLATSCSSTAVLPCPTIVYNDADPSGTYCNLKYTLGVPERIVGLSLESLLSLKNWEDVDQSCATEGLTGYDCFKKAIGFPELREFRINIVTTDKDSVNQVNINFMKAPPPDDAKVTARQFNTFILTNEGVKVPVIVTMTVW